MCHTADLDTSQQVMKFNITCLHNCAGKNDFNHKGVKEMLFIDAIESYWEYLIKRERSRITETRYLNFSNCVNTSRN